MRTLAQALDRIEALEQQIASLRRALEPDKPWPAEWRLTRRQSQLLALLARAKLAGGVATHERLRAIFDDPVRYPDCTGDISLMQCHIFHLRRAIKPLGLRLRSHFGIGYELEGDPGPLEACLAHIRPKAR